MPDSLRLDTYLWAIRMYKSRTLAAEAIKGGKVKLDENPVKAAHVVKIGETYTLTFPQQVKKIIEVTGLLEKRASYEIARQHYTDHSPPVEKQEYMPSVFKVNIKRDKGSGRPTKKDRRDMNDFGWE
ncbi:MAG: RNA-binding S4 domain-containing protein [Bacteroidetes bacterium]|nr:RNA-binding S4 domain-containing protein [Bacteroidota bacterium]